MGDLQAVRFQACVARLSRQARLRRGLQGGARGLFYGLLAALLVAAASGSVALPRPVLLAGAAALAGALAGGCAGVLRRVDRRRLLFEADRRLGSRELLGTGHELVSTGAGGTFARAVVEDASGLLSRSPARRSLGPLSLRLAPFLPLVAALAAAAFLFPVDARALFARHDTQAEIASIGEDLQGLGERLESSSRAQDLGRRLELSQELAQLGRDLADHRITNDDAMDRIQSLQDRAEREFELQVQGTPAAGAPRSSGGKGQGSPGSGASGDAGSGTPGQSADAGAGADGTAGADGASTDSRTLSDTLDRLRQAQDLLRSADRSPRGGSGAGSSASPGQQGQGNTAGGSQGGTPGTAGTGSAGQGGNGDQGSGGSGNDGGQGSESGGDGAAPTGSTPGSAPAPDKNGSPTVIARGGVNNPERAAGNVGEGDSTSFLVRALPEWTGSHLPEETVRRDYAQAAEAALLRDEVPPDLKASVRDYFTDIGMSAGSQGQ